VNWQHLQYHIQNGLILFVFSVKDELILLQVLHHENNLFRFETFLQFF